MRHKLRNRIVGNSFIIILVLASITLYTVFSSMELAQSVGLLLKNNLFLKGNIQGNLEKTQQYLTGYLLAKNSESLKEYIRYSSLLHEQMKELNREVRKDPLLLYGKESGHSALEVLGR